MSRKALFCIACAAFLYFMNPEAIYEATIASALLVWRGELPGQGLGLEQVAALAQIASFILTVYLLRPPSRQSSLPLCPTCGQRRR